LVKFLGRNFIISKELSSYSRHYYRLIISDGLGVSGNARGRERIQTPLSGKEGERNFITSFGLGLAQFLGKKLSWGTTGFLTGAGANSLALHRIAGLGTFPGLKRKNVSKGLLLSKSGFTSSHFK